MNSNRNLSGKTFGQLLDIAKAEGAKVNSFMTSTDIRYYIESNRRQKGI